MVNFDILYKFYYNNENFGIIKEKPYYFVMRDPAGSPDGDSLITNFEQIFTAYSPDTVRKVL